MEAEAAAGSLFENNIMTITKFGHSCVLVDDGQTKILFDPGMWSDVPDLTVDAIVVTHVHPDHLGLDKHLELFKSSKRIITQSEVKVELDKHQINCEVIEAGQIVQVNTVTLEAFGVDHEIIHPDLPKFKNTGYLVNGKVFHPGDSFTVPVVPVEVLLLPTTAPWCKASETMDYITNVKPQKYFAIHDGFLSENGTMMYGHWAKIAGDKINAEFIQPELGKAYEI